METSRNTSTAFMTTIGLTQWKLMMRLFSPLSTTAAVIIPTATACSRDSAYLDSEESYRIRNRNGCYEVIRHSPNLFPKTSTDQKAHKTANFSERYRRRTGADSDCESPGGTRTTWMRCCDSCHAFASMRRIPMGFPEIFDSGDPRMTGNSRFHEVRPRIYEFLTTRSVMKC
jgi:hypothetical protein